MCKSFLREYISATYLRIFLYNLLNDNIYILNLRNRIIMYVVSRVHV